LGLRYVAAAAALIACVRARTGVCNQLGVAAGSICRRRRSLLSFWFSFIIIIMLAGGHVVFSHYKYFDKVLDLANKDWINHQREAWVWMRDRWVPYPFQNNLQRLPEEDLSKCVKGLVKKNKIDKPKNFNEWLEKGFGPGIMDVFLTPYNRKVWGYDPTEMVRLLSSWCCYVFLFSSHLRSLIVFRSRRTSNGWVSVWPLSTSKVSSTT